MSSFVRRASFALALSIASIASADTGWTRATVAQAGPEVRVLAASPTRFVAATATGRLLWSDDGRSWNAVDQQHPIVGVTRLVYGNGVFLALSHVGFYRSTDGVAWTTHAWPRSIPNEIVYFNNRFVAAGFGMETSTDGLTWSLTSGASTFHTWTLANSGTVLVASGSQLQIARSTDGVNWQLVSASGFPSVNGGCTFWRGDAFVHNFGYRSTDGLVWVADAGGVGAGASCGVFQHATVTVADGTYMTRTANQGTAVFRWDGSVRTQVVAAPGSGDTMGVFHAIAAQGERVLAAGRNVHYLRDPGGSWEQVAGPLSLAAAKATPFIVENGGVIHAYTALNSFSNDRVLGALLKSADGATWTSHTLTGLDQMSALAAHGGKLYASRLDRIYVSDDGIAWSELRQVPWIVTAMRSDGLRLVVLGNSVCTGWGLASTADGVAWQTFSQAGDCEGMQHLARGPNGWFVASGNGSKIATSADGENWTAQTVAGHGHGSGIVSGSASRLWRRLNADRLQWSLDGLSWTNTAMSRFYLFSEPVWDGFRWLALGRPSSLNPAGFYDQTTMLVESADGEAWSVVRDTEQEDLQAVFSNGTLTLAFGAGGAILRRDITPALAPIIRPGMSVNTPEIGGNLVSLGAVTGAPVGSTYEVLFNLGGATPTVDNANGTLNLHHPALGSHGGHLAIIATKDGQRSNVGTLHYTQAVGFADLGITSMTALATTIKKTQKARFTINWTNVATSTAPAQNAILQFSAPLNTKLVDAYMVGGACILISQSAYCVPTGGVAAVGATYTVTAIVKPRAKGVFAAIASVRTNNNDPVIANNTAQVNFTVR